VGTNQIEREKGTKNQQEGLIIYATLTKRKTSCRHTVCIAYYISYHIISYHIIIVSVYVYVPNIFAPSNGY
jgi:hypothetical protein